MAECEYVQIPKIDLIEMYMKLKDFYEENEKLKQIIRFNNSNIILSESFLDKDLIKENFKLREKNFKLFFQVEELQKEIENLKKDGKND